MKYWNLEDSEIAVEFSVVRRAASTSKRNAPPHWIEKGSGEFHGNLEVGTGSSGSLTVNGEIFADTQISVDRSSGGSPPPGLLEMSDINGAKSYLWVDTTGKLRIASSKPTNANPSSHGTVVETQS